MRRLGGKRWGVKDGLGLVTDSSDRRLFFRLELRPILTELIRPKMVPELRPLLEYLLPPIFYRIPGPEAGVRVI
jgi:hypothetical protein